MKTAAPRLIFRHIPSRRLAAFTMVEILVVTLIALIIFTAGFTAINSAAGSQSVSFSRIRSMENARLFFQTFERDFAASYPAFNASMKQYLVTNDGTTSITTDPITNQTLASPIIANSDIQFFTRIDSGGITDQYFAVRYSVNNRGQLCRNTYQGVGPPTSADIPTRAAECVQVYGGAGYDPNEWYQITTSNAMFEDVYELLVDFQQWDPINKTWLLNAPPSSATHLHVTLVQFDRTVAAPNTPVQQLMTSNGGHAYERWLPIPSSFKQ